MDTRVGKPCGHKRSRIYSFDEAGLPYDIEESYISSSSSSTSSDTSLHEKAKSTTLPIPRIRGRLDGRLRILEREHCGLWKGQDYQIPPTRKFSRNTSQNGVTSPTLCMYMLGDREHEQLRTNFVCNSPLPKYELKLRGRLDGRLYNPKLQTRFRPSMCRVQRFPKNGVGTPSHIKNVTRHEIMPHLGPPKFFSVPLNENAMLRKLLETFHLKADRWLTQRQLDHEIARESKFPRVCETPTKNMAQEELSLDKDDFERDLIRSKVEALKTTLHNLKCPDTSNYMGNSFQLGDHSFPPTSREEHRGSISDEDFSAKEEMECQLPHSSFPSTSQERYRGRVDGRLYTPHKTNDQTQIKSSNIGDSMQDAFYQDITYNDNLALNERLLPETTNFYQIKKENHFESLQMRRWVDGRLFALDGVAKWGVNGASFQEDERTSKMCQPCFIQELYIKRCVGHRETVEDEQLNERPPTNEFPSSFDEEFVNETKVQTVHSAGDQSFPKAVIEKTTEVDKVPPSHEPDTIINPTSLALQTSSSSNVGRSMKKIYSI